MTQTRAYTRLAVDANDNWRKSRDLGRYRIKVGGASTRSNDIAGHCTRQQNQ